MTTTADAPRAATPWHFWVVAIVAMLWNGFGGYDYWMSHVAGEPYYRQMGMTDAQIAYLNGMPSWMHGVWAIGVWGSVAGSVLLLLRSKWAFHAFAISLLGAIGSLVFGLVNGMEVNGASAAIFSAVICVICAVLAWYAQAMTKRGVLR